MPSLYDIFFFVFLVLMLVLIIQRRRTERTIAREYLTEYGKAKFIPTKYFLSFLVFAVLMVLLIKTSDYLKFPLKVIFLSIFLAAIFGNRFYVENNLRKLNLPQDFVAKERFYDLIIEVLSFVFLAIALFD